MQREIVLDTETTGLDPAEGHRVVEIGAVEIINKVATGRAYHQYINPERDMPEDAFKVHGIGGDFLADQPVFAAIADAFLAFIADSPLVIHNAPFDMRFLNNEMALLRRPRLTNEPIDTLPIAQRRFPGSPNNLDALCRRFEIDASARVKHGALTDCELLAEVYMHLCGGRQVGLDLVAGVGAARRVARERVHRAPRSFPVHEAELAAHTAFVAKMKDPIWNR